MRGSSNRETPPPPSTARDKASIICAVHNRRRFYDLLLLASGQDCPRNSGSSFYFVRQFGLLCGFLFRLLLSPWQSDLILIHQFGHLRFWRRGNAHCCRDRTGGRSDGLGSREQNAIGPILSFLFLCHLLTILTVFISDRDVFRMFI
jgi:hypothetical protein